MFYVTQSESKNFSQSKVTQDQIFRNGICYWHMEHFHDPKDK